jgi:lambda family phage tail tape measure protein
MADLRYVVDIDTKGAQQSLRGLRGSIQAVSAVIASAFAFKEIATITARFEDLRTTLGILYKDVEAGAAAFEQIKTFATQSVFSVEDLTNSVIKLKAAGLDPSIAQLQLFADVASVSADSVGALQAITDLYARTTAGGLGLEDLNRLGDRGIPVFTILADKLGITRLEISKLGQTAEGSQIILGALEEGLEEAFGGASQARIGNLSQAFSNFQDAIMNAADAIGQGGFAAALTEAANKITKFIEDNEKLMQAIGVGLGGAINFVIDNLKLLGILMGGVFAAKTAGLILTITAAVFEFAKGLRSAATAGAILQGVTGVGLVKLAAGVAAAAGIVAGIEEMTSDTSNNIDEIRRGLDELQSQPGFEMPEGPLTDPNAYTPNSGGTSNFREQLNQLRETQDNVTRAAVRYFDTYKDGVDSLRLAVDQESELLQMSEEQANVQRELFEFTKRYYDTINPLQRRITELRAKDTQESRAQADEIERQIGQITEYYEANIQGLREALTLREANRKEEEAMILLTDTRRQLESELNDLLRQSNAALEDLNLTAFERELKGINRTIDDVLIKSIDKIKAQWEDGLITTDQYIAEIRKLETEAARVEAILVENAKSTREIQRSFAYGWKEAFEQYKDDATNAAEAAQRVFEKTTKGMEDAIVNFAKTGKFEFKDFMNTILEELLRSQVRQLIAKTFGGLGGNDGGGSFLGNLFGGFFATGGQIPPGRFGVVGENGAELVSGPANVTPLEGMGTNITYNINAVDAMSFKQMVAQDPEFMFAVTEQGRRSIPQTRR